MVFGNFDAAENEAESILVLETPMIRIYPANNKEGVEYDGEIEESAIVEFIQTTLGLEGGKKSDL